jgi:hypothetical protein
MGPVLLALPYIKYASSSMMDFSCIRTRPIQGCHGQNPAWLFLCLALSACSVYGTRYFSEPVEHVAPVAPYTDGFYANPRLTRFERSEVPMTFKDSLSGTVVTALFRNEHVREFIGPPILPLIPVRSGYGHSHGSNDATEWEDRSQVILELSISPGIGDQVTFTPGAFRIRKGNGVRGEAKVFSVDGVADLQHPVACNSNHTWKVFFVPGIAVEDLPILYLHSLSINKQDFHPAGIAFRIGKRSFYSALIGLAL